MIKIHVIAVGDARTPLRDELGRWDPGRFIGRDAKGEPRVEQVDDTPQVRRAIARGDLAEVVFPALVAIEGTVRQVSILEAATEAPAPLPPPVPAEPPSADADPPGTEPAPRAERPTPVPEEV